MVDEEPIENNMDEGADDYRRLNRKCMLSMYINYAAVYAILLVSYFVVIKLSKEHLGPDYDMVRYIAIAALAIVLTYMIAAPPVYYARYKYMITKDKIDVRYGILIIRHIMVPIERVHQVEVSRGPINNLLGLGHVNITTAGGTATISYLELEEAEKVADRLNDMIGVMLRDRE
ncbi:MAG: PH domain-containing protein [Euryarchaeota archaeon]|nr:PH domain-containing protein [Euryarchaeota archaeon]